MTDEYLLVLTTCGGRDMARALAEALIRERLAACVNIVPGLESVYLWEGDMQQDHEVLLLIKTKTERFDAVADTIRRVNDYELPEILAVPVAGGSEAYLNWIATAVDPARGCPGTPNGG